MPDSTTATSNFGYLAHELAYYMQTATADIVLANLQTIADKYDAHYSASEYHYQLPLGTLQVLALTLYLPSNTDVIDIDRIRMMAVKAGLAWQKTSLSHKGSNATQHELLIVDIQFFDETEHLNKAENACELKKSNHDQANLKRFEHHFNTRYLSEELIVDRDDGMSSFHVFSWQDWQSILTALATPCELWQYLTYRLAQLQSSNISHLAICEAEDALVQQFLQSPALFNNAIATDNALIKYKIQDEPNPALVAMTLAYKNKNVTAQMYHQHMEQAAILWSQLSMQMIETVDNKLANKSAEPESEVDFFYWQQQLLDESLFSRHELIRTLYKHPKQGQKLQDKGYVVHQHSYESLGRHYVLIFYGKNAQGQHSKQVIQPKLSKIALDVATRLPIAELHHIIVLGVDFIIKADETFIDIDLWIQPVQAMTQRERQLTQQLQRLKQKQRLK